MLAASQGTIRPVGARIGSMPPCRRCGPGSRPRPGRSRTPNERQRQASRQQARAAARRRLRTGPQRAPGQGGPSRRRARPPRPRRRPGGPDLRAAAGPAPEGPGSFHLPRPPPIPPSRRRAMMLIFPSDPRLPVAAEPATFQFPAGEIPDPEAPGAAGGIGSHHAASARAAIRGSNPMAEGSDTFDGATLARAAPAFAGSFQVASTGERPRPGAGGRSAARRPGVAAVPDRGT